MSDTSQSWQKFLHPETLRDNLLSMSLFITAFETFKSRIIEKPRWFFCRGFDENGPIMSDGYKADVSSRSGNRFLASLLWLSELGAIEQDDIETFHAIRVHRNELVHEPLAFLASHDRNFDITKFRSLVELFAKIEKWWVINVELAVDPEMLPDGADPAEIIPGPIWSLQLLPDIALGVEPEEGFYYKALMQRESERRG